MSWAVVREDNLIVDGEVRIGQGHTERDVSFILHTLPAEQRFEQDNRADEDLFLGQLGGFEVPAVKSFDCLDPHFVEYYWAGAREGYGEIALTEVGWVQAHEEAK